MIDMIFYLPDKDGSSIFKMAETEVLNRVKKSEFIN